jgi:hypothetical protein
MQCGVGNVRQHLTYLSCPFSRLGICSICVVVGFWFTVITHKMAEYRLG